MLEHRQQVVIMGTFRFPEGDAAAARVLGIGKTLRQSGYEVHFAGWEENGRSEDRCDEGKFSYQGFYYSSQNQFRLKRLNPISRLLKYLTMGVGAIGWLRRYSDENKIDAVISYHGGVIYLSLLKFFCWKRNIKLIADCTEWYDPDSLPGGKWGIAAMESELRMRLINPWIGQIISISRLLRGVYERKGCHVLLVPPTVDLTDSKWVAEPTQGEREKKIAPRLRLVYAGVPGKKDVLRAVLLSLDALCKEGFQISLDLVGPSEAEVLTTVNGDRELLHRLRGRVIFHGRIAQSKVPALLRQADFSILFRPQRRSSHAGFSTKLVESLAAGVPIIANSIGDVPVYINDGIEGILVIDEAYESVIAGLRRALALDGKKLFEMREAAKRCARQNFHYEVYRDDLRKFIEDCQ
ncbi:glycosyltransferase [Variovorax paradoxus]|uniref:glycosyltransferase n=1 Tax=Variovorax paradoxus TaxID=34073 RepID=UPI003ECFA81A